LNPNFLEQNFPHTKCKFPINGGPALQEFSLSSRKVLNKCGKPKRQLVVRHYTPPNKISFSPRRPNANDNGIKTFESY
jgi:hypothetical protein